MVFTVFKWNINYYNSCPFVLHLSEEPSSTFPSISLSINLTLLHPPLSFWWPSSELAVPCKHLSCIGGPKLDIFLQMKSHKHQHEGHGHFTWMTANNLVMEFSLHCCNSTELTQEAHCWPSSKITQGQSFKYQRLNFRMPFPGSLDMAE